MKKAKIVLSAVALFAVVGGAFAFKASRFLPANVYSSYLTTNAGGQPTISCKLTQQHATNAGTPTFTYTTVLANGACPARVNTFTVPID